jgi:hypothetical protein
MRRRAILRLAVLPFREAPLVFSFLTIVALGIESVLVALAFRTSLPPRFMLKALLLTAGGLAYFAAVFLGRTLRLLARPETRLLPGFGRSLAGAGAFWALFFLGIPFAEGLLFFSPAALFAPAALFVLLAVYALLINAWPMPRGSLLLAFGFLGYAFLPPAVREGLFGLARSPAIGLGALLVAGILVRLLVGHVLAPSDPGEALAPLAGTGTTTMSGFSRGWGRVAVSGPSRPSAFAQRLDGWMTEPSLRRLRERVAAYRARPCGRGLVRLLRPVLMPHENPRGWFVRALFFLLILTFFVFPFVHGHASARGEAWRGPGLGFLLGYATLMGCGALGLLPLAREKFKRHLAELYFTLGLPDRPAFKAAVADAYLGLLPGVILVTLALVAGVALVLAPSRLLLLLATVLAVIPFFALAVLGISLHVPARSLPRLLIGFLFNAVAFVALPLALHVVRLLGPAVGLGILVTIGAVVSLGTWVTARREWIATPPEFDTPDPRLA